eukprot:TRINITY_DN9386_c0_g1_i2.p1 TRINITY_DN9386_c0_g1~~TRINITY_DN9386_c0_g1_i2.p1  ORF type:complete len:590 (-),score=196.71 TRINITY_DN9386_c0_g1_i2:118-1860(-)
MSALLFGQDGGTRATLIEHRDTSRITPLHKAAENGHLELVQWLIDRGADVNSTDSYGMTPLHAACTRSQFDVIVLLVSHGADVSKSTNDDQLALHYFLKYCKDTSLPMLCCILTLLAPSLAHLHCTTENGSFLHNACRNVKSTQIEFVIQFLLVNGVDDRTVDSKGRVCWAQLEYRAAKRLAKTLDREDIVNYAHKAAGGVEVEGQLRMPTSQAPPPPSTGRRDPWGMPIQSNKDEDAVMQILAEQLEEVKKALEDISSAVSGEEEVKRLDEAKAKMEHAIQTMAPAETDDILSSMIMDKVGDNAVRELIKLSLGHELSDASDREVLRKGRALVTTRWGQCLRVYYTLYSDCIVLLHADFVHERLKDYEAATGCIGDSAGPSDGVAWPPQCSSVEHEGIKSVFLMPLKRLTFFHLPTGYGDLQNSFQIVYSRARGSPKSFTLKLMEESESDELSRIIKERSELIRKFIDPSPPAGLFVCPTEILVEGYLAKKGQVIYTWQRYHVRATVSHLFYYNTETDLTPRGIISIHGMPVHFQDDMMQFQWTDDEHKRRFIFTALTPRDYNDWKKVFDPAGAPPKTV